MATDVLVRGLRVAMAAALAAGTDIRHGAGALS